MPITISLFGDLYDTTPKPLAFDSFADLAAEFTPEVAYDRKETPLFSPVKYLEGTSRENANVESISLAVMDFDEVQEADFGAYLERLTTEGTEFFVYTTYSHDGVKWCARVMIPLSEVVSPQVWPLVWANMYLATGKLCDKQCKDPSRMYYAPVVHPDRQAVAVAHYQPGKPLDVAAYGTVVLSKAQALAATSNIGKTYSYDDIGVSDIQRLVTASRRGRTPYKIWLAEKCQALLAGDSLGKPGQRDKTVFDLVCGILDYFPRANPDQLIRLFAPSLQAMELEAPGAPTSAQVLDKIRRRSEKAEEKQAQALQVTVDTAVKNISLAFGMSGRTNPYTPEELLAFTKDLGLPDPSFLNQHWIIQRADSYYILVGGQYKGPFVWSELARSAQIYLAPASSAGVQTTVLKPTGLVEVKTPQELMQDYGMVASNVRISLSAQRSSYNPKTATITEAPTPLRFTEGCYDTEIEQWLVYLGGVSALKLFDWLSAVMRLDEPCAALYLEGMGGVGKSLLAEGIASLWSDKGPTALVDAMAGFNETVTECPLLFADESIPKDFRGRARTGEIRQLIQARTRPVRRKFLPTATIWGACRLILAANNADLINSSEPLTFNDIEALVERFVHIDATQATDARDYLRTLGKEKLRYWKEEGIAKFCLWLAKNHTFDDRHRFLVAGDRTTLHRRLTVSSGIRSAVTCWLVSYLLDPKRYDATGAMLVRVSKGRLLANVRALQTGWGLYDTSERVPTVAEMAKALTGISKGERVHLTDGSGNLVHYHEVDPTNLVAWAEEFGFATKESLTLALATDTKKLR